MGINKSKDIKIVEVLEVKSRLNLHIIINKTSSSPRELDVCIKKAISRILLQFRFNEIGEDHLSEIQIALDL